METHVSSILIPGVFSTITEFLDDEQIHNLKQQSKNLNFFITQEQQANSYWLGRVENLLDMRLIGFILDWQLVYQMLKIRSRQFIIICILPTNQLVDWLKTQMLNTPQEFIKNLCKDFIEADRIDAYIEFKELLQKPSRFNVVMTDYELFVLILESPDGWNILLQEILNICKESSHQMGRFKADLFNTAALKSTDIAHYLMLQEFPEFQKFNPADDENLITIVNNSPINLSYYLRYCPKQVEKLLEEILGGCRFWRIFENYTVNAQTTEFWKLIISNPQDYTFVHILQSIDQFDAKVDYFIGLLFKSGKLNTQQLQYDIFARFLHKIVYQETPFTNPNTGRSMEEFSVLDKYLNYSISKYISLNILSVSSAPLVYYLINKKRMPLWTYTYLKKLQHITHIRQFKSIIMNKSSKTFTSQEALKIMDKLFSLIGNFDSGISSQSLMNMLLEIHVIYGNIKE